MGEHNSAGEEFMEFCAVNQNSVMNTWFQNVGINLASWKHLVIKGGDVIDYVAKKKKNWSKSDSQGCTSDEESIAGLITNRSGPNSGLR